MEGQVRKEVTRLGHTGSSNAFGSFLLSLPSSSRIHVTLFIKDWYLGVSNNKLDVQGDFEQLIKDPKRCTSTDRDIVSRFKEWLKHAHREFDREVTPEELWMEKPPHSSSRNGMSYYKAMRYGRRADDVWREGQKVRIVLDAGAAKTTGQKRKRGQATSSSNISNKDGEHLGRILHFEVDPDADSCK